MVEIYVCNQIKIGNNEDAMRLNTNNLTVTINLIYSHLAFDYVMECICCGSIKINWRIFNVCLIMFKFELNGLIQFWILASCWNKCENFTRKVIPRLSIIPH